MCLIIIFINKYTLFMKSCETYIMNNNYNNNVYYK